MSAAKRLPGADAGHGEKGAHDVVSVSKDSVEILVDLTYVRSWPGLRMVSRLSSTQLSDSDKLIAAFEFYEEAVPNVDDVVAALGNDVDASEVFDLLAWAVKEAAPKN